MLNIWSLDRGANRNIGYETARITQTIEAARCSLYRFTRLHDTWMATSIETHTPDLQQALLNELAMACAYDRELRTAISKACRGMICVPRWTDESAAIRHGVEAAVVWARSAGLSRLSQTQNSQAVAASQEHLDRGRNGRWA